MALFSANLLAPPSFSRRISDHGYSNSSRAATPLDRIEELLGDNARALLDHKSQTIPKDQINLPGPDFIDRIWSQSDRSPAVLRSLQSLFNNGRLAGTGYLSILPVDQGIEHSAGASFAPNPQYFDPDNIVKLAIEGGCNAVASTFGVLGTVARKYAHKIPFIVKINHNELLTLPNKFDQVMFGTVKGGPQHGRSGGRRDDLFWIRRIDAADHGSSAKLSRKPMSSAWHVFSGATCATRSSKPPKATCTRRPISRARQTISASRSRPTSSSRNFPNETAATSAVEQALGGSYGKTSKLVYEKLTTDNPIDLVRYQVANCYMGRCGLINSGGESKGASDLAEAVRTAVINKRGGGTGLISGRKAFQRPMSEGVELLNAIQDVYLSEDITVA